MKFLVKDPASPILSLGLVYREGAHNDRLLELLRAEQRGYCAYTEKRFSLHDTSAVEHFDRRLKGVDGYLNYYAVLQSANQRKRRKEAKHERASFFATRFFQAPGAFERRIRYIAGDGVYEEIDPADTEAEALIDYLGLNDHDVVEERRKHVARLRDIFLRATWTAAQQLEHFHRHPEELSYPSALTVEFSVDIEPFLSR